MKKHATVVTSALLLCGLLLNSCATIFTRASYPITIQSTPENASLVITNQHGQIVYQGTTPANVRLKASRGYMKSETYELKFTKDGYQEQIYTIQSGLDGWYLGNILIGGLIGMLIVDPASGAMYRFKRSDRQISMTLTESNQISMLQIYDLHNLPEELQGEEIVLINK